MKNSRFHSLLKRAVMIICLLAVPQTMLGQWQTSTHDLKAGFNGVYLFVDLSHAASIDTLLGATPIEEVWLWKVDLSAAQFATTPQVPVDGGSRWLVWKKGKPGETTLNKILGNTAYLIKTASDFRWEVKGKIVPPRYLWTSKGQNLMGFPTRAGAPPNFDSYLSKVPGLVQDLEIFEYQGGALGAGNPSKVRALRSTNVDRGKAFWLRSKAGRFNRYFGPVEVQLQNITGVHFGERLSQYRIVIRNLTDGDLTVTMEHLNSEAPPSGQTAIAGKPPLFLRGALDPATLNRQFSSLTGPVNWALKPFGQEGSVQEIVLGLDRAALSGAVGSFFAGIIRFSDSLGFTQFDVGSSAKKGSLSGLWVADVNVSQVRHDLRRAVKTSTGANKLDANGKVVVQSTDNSFGNVERSYPLRLIIHVAADGSMRLLQRVYFGYSSGFQPLLATQESLIAKEHLALSKRVSAVHFPWTETNQPWAFSGGTFSPGQTIQTTVSVGHNDHAANPFLHTYHPDHDNRTAVFTATQARGVESYDIERVVQLSLVNPTGDFNQVTRAHNRLNGDYVESVTMKGRGNETKQFDVKGRFVMNRISQIETLTTP